MPYQFATQQLDYSDLASGRVLYSLPGHPAFPIRLVSEIFQRCLAWRARWGQRQRVIVYDPCCGTAYHLTALAFGHWSGLDALIGSDVALPAVELARRNLALLTREGMDERIRQLTAAYQEFGKESHDEALKSAAALRQQLIHLSTQHSLPTRVFQASAFDGARLQALLDGTRIDIVLTDVPYGQRSQWQLDTVDPQQTPGEVMLRALYTSLHPDSIVAIASDKQQKIKQDGYERLERFQIGKRQVVLLKPVFC